MRPKMRVNELSEKSPKSSSYLMYSGVRRIYFSRGRKRFQGGQNNFSAPPVFFCPPGRIQFCPWGRTDKRRGRKPYYTQRKREKHLMIDHSAIPNYLSYFFCKAMHFLIRQNLQYMVQNFQEYQGIEKEEGILACKRLKFSLMK